MTDRTRDLRLKAAFRDLVEAAGGVARAGQLTGRTHPTISRYGNPSETDCFPPLDVVAVLEAETAIASVTRALADLAGYVLVDKSAADKSDALFAQAVGSMAKETGEAMASIGSAMADGEVCADDAARVLPELRQSIEAQERLAAALESRAARAAPRLVR